MDTLGREEEQHREFLDDLPCRMEQLALYRTRCMTGRCRLEARDLVRRLFDEVFNERKLEACDEIFAVDYVEHAIAPFGHEAPGAVNGPEHMRGVVDWLVAQFPDVTMTVESIVGDDDLVVARVHSTGTSLGKLNGVVPPTEKQFSADQSHWYRVADAKLAEHWAIRDDLTTMLQLGVLGLPGPPS